MGFFTAPKGDVVVPQLSRNVLALEHCTISNMTADTRFAIANDFATNIASGRYHAPVVKGSAYETTYGDTLKQMDEHVDSGSNPDEMAMAIYQIINDKNPKLHYKVGAFMQKFSIVLKRILPDRVYEKMLMKHYKL